MKLPTRYQDIETLRTVVELRYPKAHQYWDVSGGLLETLEGRIPALNAEALGENGFSLKGRPDSGTPNVEFYWNRCAIAHEGSTEPTPFTETASTVWSLVWQKLKVTHLNRVGHRVLHFLPTDTKQAATDWVNRLPLWSLGEALPREWGVPINDGIVIRTRTRTRRVRLEVAAAEVAAKGGRRTGVVVDVDMTLLPEETITRASFIAAEFMKENYRFLQERVPALLAGVRSEDR